MKSRFNEERETNNRTVFKRLYLRSKIDCHLCQPNQGCNRRHKKLQRNWKKFRKKQWKERRSIFQELFL